MAIKKGFTILADPPVPVEAEDTIDQVARQIYAAAVKKKRKLTSKVVYDGLTYFLVALPTKAAILVIPDTFRPLRVWAMPSTRLYHHAGYDYVKPFPYSRSSIDAGYIYNSEKINRHLYRIVPLSNLYYQTNRSESLFLETEYFFRVVGRVSIQDSLVFQDESVILLWGTNVSHVPNSFFSYIAPKLLTLSLDVYQQNYLFHDGLNQLFANGIPSSGFARLPTPGGDTPYSGTLLTFNWKEDIYGRDNYFAPPEDEYIQTAEGYIVRYAYLQAMLADMNKPYAEKQYTNFTATFSFVTEDEGNIYTVYSIPVEYYGFVDFTVYTGSTLYDDLATTLMYQSATEGLIIYVSNYSDEVDSDTGITTRTIIHSTMATTSSASHFGYLVCFNTDEFAYAIVDTLSLIDYWGPDVSGLGYDEVVTQHASYLNGDKIYARIGVTYPGQRVTATDYSPPFPPNPNFGDQHFTTMTDTLNQSGASVQVIDQYEMSIDGPVPSNQFQFFQTYYTHYKHYPNSQTIVNSSIESNYDYPVGLPYNSITTESQIGIGVGTTDLSAVNPYTASWEISGDIVNPYYSYTSEGVSGYNPAPQKIANEDSYYYYCYIKYFPSIFGDSVMTGYDIRHEGREWNEAESNSFANSIVYTNLTSGDMQEFFNPVNIKKTKEVDLMSVEAGHRGPWSYQDEDAFIYAEWSYDDMLVSSTLYQMGWRGWVVQPDTTVVHVNYDSYINIRQYAYREGMAHHVANVTDYQPYETSSHIATTRQNIYSHIAPDLASAYVSDAGNTSSDSLFYGWFFQRWHFLDKNYNKLGELQLGYDDTQYDTFRDQLGTACANEKAVIELAEKYKDNDLEFDIADQVILQNQKIAREAAEDKLEQFMFYNDFASIPLIYYCLRTKTPSVDHYIIIDT